MHAYSFDMWPFVKSYYAQPHRFYHTWYHVRSMFEGYVLHFGVMRPEELIAIAYHDAIYNPWSKTNEEDSCQLMRAHRPHYYPAVPDDFLDRADTIILDTSHNQPFISNLSERVTDLDLMILGKSEKIYAEYVANIRKEYSQYSDESINDGRRKFLVSMLAKDQIYRTKIMIDAYESTARANMQNELIKLNGSETC